jgi:site-specific DNA-methyltransferase (adenine-specific)
MLANEWDTVQLEDWGVDLPVWEEEENKTLEDVSEDDFNEADENIKVRCQRGDVWLLGEHRLMCGDSVDLEDVKKLMGGGNG